MRMANWLTGVLVGAVLWMVAAPAQAEYLPRAEWVAESVYAIVGPLGLRSKENEGLNANYGGLHCSERPTN